MRQLAQSELDGSPNKGPKKQLKVLADALDRTIETGASTANMGHAVKARYKGMFGGKPLDDLDKEQAHDAVASTNRGSEGPETPRLVCADTSSQTTVHMRALVQKPSV